MIDRIVRHYSYAMNHTEGLQLNSATEVDEVPESCIKRIHLPPTRRRIQGEALAKLGRPAPKRQPVVIAESASPFEMARKIRKQSMKQGNPSQDRAADKAPASAPEPAAAKEPEPAKSKAPIRLPRKSIEVGQEIRIDGKKAILTWIGVTKFEVAMVGSEAKRRCRFSDYPTLKLGAVKVKKVRKERSDAAS